MRKLTCTLASCAFLAVAGMASAGIMNVGPFTGDLQEGWESGQADGQFLPTIQAFGGFATVNTPNGGNGLHTTSGWNSLQPRSGVRLFGTIANGAEFVFDDPISKFGGYFSSIFSTTGGVATVYNQNNQQIAAVNISMAMNTWTWNGWMATDGDLIGRVVIQNNENGGAFIMTDDMEVGFIPAPGALALLGLAGLASRRRRRG